MSKLRTRAKAPVDYTDFLSPAAKAVGGKRKAWEEEDAGGGDAEEEEEEEEIVVIRKKKQEKPAAKKAKASNARGKKGRAAEDDEEEEEERAEVKPKAKTKTKTSQRQKEEEEEEKPKPKAKKTSAKAQAAEEERTTTTAIAVVATAKTRRVERDTVGTPVEMEALRKKYEALYEFRETETERLLQEAKRLAKEEKRTYEKLVAKLKGEVAALSSRAQQTQIEHQTRVEELQVEHTLRVETLKREREDSVAANERLRRQIKELESDVKRATRSGGGGGGRGGRHAISGADAAAVARTAELSVELSQAKKLLEVYRLVTSTELRLIQTLDDDDEDEQPEHYTDVACAVVDSVSGTRFPFDLAVPHDAKEEVEYVPSEAAASAAFQTPTYLQEELSFKRSELTKFMRTLLDVVIRKKAADSATKR